MKNVKIVDDSGAEVLGDALEIVAQNIEKLSAIGQAIKASRLTEVAVLTLLKHSTGLYQNQVKIVLDALPELEKNYLKPKKAKTTK